MVIQNLQSGRNKNMCLDLNFEPMDVFPMLDDEIEVRGEERRNGMVPTKLCARGHWRPHEDAKLKELVAHYGPQNWNLIAEKLPCRSGKSCRLRWFNQLDPRINRKAYNEEEEERLVAAHRVYGNKWAIIAKLFPGRTDNSVKNHWHVIMARLQRDQSSIHRRRNASSSTSIIPTEPFGGITTAPDEDMMNKQNIINNACSDSTVISTNNINTNTSTGDESAASTCTNLSLNHDYSPANNSMSRFNPLLQAPAHQPFSWSHLGLHSLSAAENVEVKEFKANEAVVVVDEYNSDDSNSEVVSNSPATDSVANYSRIQDEEKKAMRFIDFLGVGLTN